MADECLIKQVLGLARRIDGRVVSFDTVREAVTATMGTEEPTPLRRDREPDSATMAALIDLMGSVAQAGVGRADIEVIRRVSHQISVGAATGLLDADFFARCGK